MTKAKPQALNDSDSIGWQDTNCERNETSLSVLALFQELAVRREVHRLARYHCEGVQARVRELGSYCVRIWIYRGALGTMDSN